MFDCDCDHNETCNVCLPPKSDTDMPEEIWASSKTWQAGYSHVQCTDVRRSPRQVKYVRADAAPQSVDVEKLQLRLEKVLVQLKHASCALDAYVQKVECCDPLDEPEHAANQQLYKAQGTVQTILEEIGRTP